MVNPLNEDVIEELAKAKAKADAGNPGTKQPSIFAKFAAMGYSPIPIYKIDGRYTWPLKWSDSSRRTSYRCRDGEVGAEA